MNAAGEIVVEKARTGASSKPTPERDRFEAVRGNARVKWRTDELMALLRGPD